MHHGYHLSLQTSGDANNEIHKDRPFKVENKSKNAGLTDEDAFNNTSVDNGQEYDGKAYDPRKCLQSTIVN